MKSVSVCNHKHKYEYNGTRASPSAHVTGWCFLSNPFSRRSEGQLKVQVSSSVAMQMPGKARPRLSILAVKGGKSWTDQSVDGHREEAMKLDGAEPSCPFNDQSCRGRKGRATF